MWMLEEDHQSKQEHQSMVKQCSLHQECLPIRVNKPDSADMKKTQHCDTRAKTNFI
jgi:hypothetical protein